MPTLTKKQKQFHEQLKNRIESDQRKFVEVEEVPELAALVDAQLIELSSDQGTTFARIKPTPTEPPTEPPTDVKPNGAAKMEATIEVTEKKQYKIADFLRVAAGQPVALHTKASRGGRKGNEKYPWAEMEVGDSFLLIAQPGQKPPWETFQSTVSSTSKRYADPHPSETKVNSKGETVPVLVYRKKWAMKRVNKGDTYENGYVEPETGARVFRVI